ncbi:uncharacterized protein ISCGN_027567 [Ixodes scapularis]
MRKGAVARGRLPRFETALLILVLFGASSSLAAVVPETTTTVSTEPTVVNITSTPVSAALFQGPPVTSGSYWLRGPPEYISLSGDIVVEYGLPSVGGPAGSGPGGLTAHVLAFKDDTVLAKTDVPRRGDSGRIVFACGLVHKAGRYYFQLVAADGETVLARSKQDTVVRWPEVVSHVPLILETYGSDVVVTFEFPYLRCPPLQQDNYGFTVSLVYRGTHAEPESWFQESVVDQKGLPSWAALRGQDVTLDCEAFDKAGFYQVRLTCADDTSLPVISESVPVRVVWSSRYMLNVAQSLIASCHDGINIVYRYPTTCSKDRDKVRVYGLPRTSGVTGAAPSARYLFERRLPKGKHALTLGCHLFPEGYARFCFVYVSVARNGAVFELQKQCRPWTLEPGGRVSGWGNWSQWSFCTGSCGRGTQSRYRLCGIPDGVCRGSAFDTRTCSLEPCPETTLAPDTTTTTPLSSTYCLCGCTLSVFRKETIRYSASAPCDGPVSWIFKPFSAPRIVVQFTEVHLGSELEAISVRDGTSSLGVLLASLPHEESSVEDEGPLRIASLSGPIRIDFSPANRSHPPPDGDSATFKISFWEDNSTLDSSSRRTYPGASLLPSSVHVMLAFLGSAVLVTTAVLVVAYRSRCCCNCWSEPSHKDRSLVSESLCSDELDHRPTVRLLGAAGSLTSISEVSLEDEPASMEAPEKFSGESPEDFMDQACLFKSVGSVCTASVESTPVPKKRVPVATVSPQPQSRLSTPRPPLRDHRHFKSLLKPAGDSVESLEGRQSSCCSRRTLKVAATTSGLRDSSVPLAASLSELSTSGTEDGFELDYYDYGCHDVPGSFFSAQVLGWPPFLPLPPDDELLELQLQHYTLPPPETDLVVTTHVNESEEEQ